LEPGVATHTERSVRVRILPDSSRAWAPTAGSFRFPSQRRNSWRGLARHCKFNADHKREDTVSWGKHISRSHRLSSACAHQSCMNTIGVASVTRRRTCPRHEVANECVQVSPSSITIIVILCSCTCLARRPVFRAWLASPPCLRLPGRRAFGASPGDWRAFGASPAAPFGRKHCGVEIQVFLRAPKMLQDGVDTPYAKHTRRFEGGLYP